MPIPPLPKRVSFYHKAVYFAGKYGGVPFMIVIAVLFCWCLWALGVTVYDGIKTISDPTERGCAIIAAAIVFHAIFGKSTVDVKSGG